MVGAPKTLKPIRPLQTTHPCDPPASTNNKKTPTINPLKTLHCMNTWPKNQPHARKRVEDRSQF